MTKSYGRQNLRLAHRFLFHFARRGFKGSELLWNFVTKFVAYPDNGTELQLPDGFIMAFDDHDYMALCIYKGQFEHEVMDFLQLASPIDLVIDVGANIGYTLWEALKNSGEGCRAIGIEPASKCYSRLTKLAGDISRNVEIVNIGLGAESTIRKLYESDNGHNSGAGTFVSEFATDEGIDIQLATMDNLLREKGLSNFPISICKIDTEGFESDVLRGAKSTFESNKPEILLIEVSPEYGSIDYVKYLWEIFDQGYTFAALTLHRGWIRTLPKMEIIDLNHALQAKNQFNLAIYRDDLGKRFKSLM